MARFLAPCSSVATSRAAESRRYLDNKFPHWGIAKAPRIVKIAIATRISRTVNPSASLNFLPELKFLPMAQLISLARWTVKEALLSTGPHINCELLAGSSGLLQQ
jgi:hypothetical protein